MPPNEMLDPDQAVAKWRDQIEENQRLQQVIADRDATIEELKRLNFQTLFEAQRYQGLHRVAIDECGAWRHRAHVLEAQLDAIGMVMIDSARSIESIADTAFERARAAPAPQPADLPAMQQPITDDPIEPLEFLQNHRTPVPEMEGIR